MKKKIGLKRRDKQIKVDQIMAQIFEFPEKNIQGKDKKLYSMLKGVFLSLSTELRINLLNGLGGYLESVVGEDLVYSEDAKEDKEQCSGEQCKCEKGGDLQNCCCKVLKLCDDLSALGKKIISHGSWEQIADWNRLTKGVVPEDGQPFKISGEKLLPLLTKIYTQGKEILIRNFH